MVTVEDIINQVLSTSDLIEQKMAIVIITSLDDYKNSSIDTPALIAALSVQDEEAAMQAINPDAIDMFLIGVGIAVGASFISEIKTAYVAGANLALIELGKVPSFAIDAVTDVALTAQITEAVIDASTTTVEGIRNIISKRGGAYTTYEAQAKAIVDMIGLTPSQATAVSNYRAQLESGTVMGRTNPLARRVADSDLPLIRMQMSTGGLSQDKIDELVANYQKSLLEKRVADIARTETMSAINAGRQSLWEQLLDDDLLDGTPHKFWAVTPDDRLRDTHAAIPVMNPNGVPIRDKFATPFGFVNGPQDRLVDLINCRCVLVLGQPSPII